VFFDLANKVVQYCAQGMSLEGEGKFQQAKELFLRAWQEAVTDFEKSTAAHYVARHQDSIVEKLQWDETALQFALKIKDEPMKAYLPSLHLNIAKCYEDLKDLSNARKHYQCAGNYTTTLPDDGYGNMIRRGIESGMERVK
jgi:tetratricopeptide (TPR) repeat protein